MSSSIPYVFQFWVYSFYIWSIIMNKKSIVVWALMISAVVVAWCFGKAKDGNGEDFTIASCNDYVKLMRCVADNAWESSKEANAVIDQAVAAWKNLPQEDLAQTCSLALANAASYAATYEQQWCTVPGVAPEVIQEEMTGALADPSVIEAISGKVDSNEGMDALNDSATTGTTDTNTQKEDDNKKVETIVNEITTGEKA